MLHKAFWMITICDPRALGKVRGKRPMWHSDNNEERPSRSKLVRWLCGTALGGGHYKGESKSSEQVG
jgi:hypothetical protein